ncbi:polysaccharide deacetylase [Clostridium aestuarii]|uniref:Polysaccharide deacetylase n=1 Tax=Clostridium aestuarii TaxID=338193 RepID=A0ABT4D0K8_9CLOT|nr:polysaccharide deacetylase family protein [Clostridium aestuarii]MCY6484771.1 polysaccharide deacetylase [Clostridium aestuarii]
MKKFLSKIIVTVMVMALFMTVGFKVPNAYGTERVPTIKEIVLEKSRLYEGEIQTLNIFGKGSGNIQYRVWILNKNKNEWKDITDGFTHPSNVKAPFKITIPELKAGEYSVSVWVKRENEKPLNQKGYDNYFAIDMSCLENNGQVYDRKLDEAKSKERKINIPSIEKVVSEKSYLYDGNNVNLDIVSRGFEKVQYRVWVCYDKTDTWFEATKGYTKPIYAQDVCKVTIPKLSSGEYSVIVWVKRENKQPLNKKGYDDLIKFNIKCLDSNEENNDKGVNEAEINEELKAMRNNYKLGETIELKAKEEGKIQYRYNIYNALDEKIVVESKEYKGNLTWKPEKQGVYVLRIHVKNLEKEQDYDVNKLIVVGQPYKKIVEKKNNKTIYTNNKNTGKVAYLTFDDGPSKKVTPRVLKILDNYNVKATFFVTGEFAQMNKNLIKQEYAKGHTIGNHTYSHVYKKIYSSTTAFMNEIKKTEGILKSIIPEYNTKLIRFPGGSMSRNKAYKDAVKNAGYSSFDWNASTGDATAYLVPVDKLIEKLKKTCANKNTVIILMHDAPVKTTTADALPKVIEYLQSQGYEFKTLE